MASAPASPQRPDPRCYFLADCRYPPGVDVCEPRRLIQAHTGIPLSADSSSWHPPGTTWPARGRGGMS